jgi:7-cyano-7-deazaguanine synthase
MSEKAVALLSGGLNSFVAAAFYKKHGAGEIVEAMCFNYGQEHCDEIDHAAELAQILDVPFSVFSPQMSWELTDRMTLEQVDHMEQVGLNNSFWYGRDLMIHLLGASRATALKATKVITGAHNSRVDRLALELLGKTIEAANFGVSFEHPFSDTVPGHSFKVAYALGIWDEAVSKTYDCLRGGNEAHKWGFGCGECEGCLIRAEGHEAALGILKKEYKGDQEN